MAGGLTAELAARPPTPSRHRTSPRWIVLWALIVVAELVAIGPAIIDRGPPVDDWDVAFRLVGGTFAACGLIAWRRRPDSRAGPAMVLTGFAWLIGPLLRELDWPVADTLALVLGDVWIVLLAALLLSYPSGGLPPSAADRAVVAAFALAFIPLAVVWALFLESDGNLLAVFGDAELADAVDTVQRSIAFCASVAACALLVRRWRAATPALRRSLAPAFAGGVSLLLFAATLLSDLVTGIPTHPLRWLLWLCVIGFVATPAAFLAGLLYSRLARAGVADLVVELPGLRGAELQTALAEALGDPTLVVGGWLPEFRAYADADGKAVLPPTAGSGRASTPIAHDGRPLALLVHDASLAAELEVLEAVCAAAELALANEHLQAQSRERLAEVQASRSRIVEAGDAERRRLERDLHDGAQQRLVAVALQLRLIRARIHSDPASVEQLAITAGDELAASLDELRELARGIHPAVLDQGLPAALESLAARSSILTTLTVDIADRLPQPVELAAYFVTSEALTNIAKHAEATAATVRLSRRDGVAILEVADNGKGGADRAGGSGLRGLVDRVEAVEGTLRISSPAGGGTTVTAEMPCA
jgi:signal transduction histidine kinase